MAPQDWGVVTRKDNMLYVHVLKPTKEKYIFLPNLNLPVKTALSLNNGKSVKFKQQPEGIFIYNDGQLNDEMDNIIKLTLK
jgi:alpha-L-fucosidase